MRNSDQMIIGKKRPLYLSNFVTKNGFEQKTQSQIANRENAPLYKFLGLGTRTQLAMALFPEEVSSDLNTWPPIVLYSLLFLSQVQFVQPITTRHSMFLQSLLSAFVHLIFRVYANIIFFLGQSEINREWPYWSYTLTSIQLWPPSNWRLGDSVFLDSFQRFLPKKNRTTLRTTYN